jgi:hypothetical protein
MAKRKLDFGSPLATAVGDTDMLPVIKHDVHHTSYPAGGNPVELFMHTHDLCLHMDRGPRVWSVMYHGVAPELADDLVGRVGVKRVGHDTILVNFTDVRAAKGVNGIKFLLEHLAVYAMTFTWTRYGGRQANV